MKAHIIKAKKFIDDNGDSIPSDQYGIYIVRETLKGFDVWEDRYGDYCGGEDPIYSTVNSNSVKDDFKYSSLGEVKEALLNEDCIEESDNFVPEEKYMEENE